MHSIQIHKVSWSDLHLYLLYVFHIYVFYKVNLNKVNLYKVNLAFKRDTLWLTLLFFWKKTVSWVYFQLFGLNRIFHCCVHGKILVRSSWSIFLLLQDHGKPKKLLYHRRKVWRSNSNPSSISFIYTIKWSPRTELYQLNLCPLW